MSSAEASTLARRTRILNRSVAVLRGRPALLDRREPPARPASRELALQALLEPRGRSALAVAQRGRRVRPEAPGRRARRAARGQRERPGRQARRAALDLRERPEVRALQATRGQRERPG